MDISNEDIKLLKAHSTVNEGALNLNIVEGEGDINPPDVDSALENNVQPPVVNTKVALKSIMRVSDMVISLVCKAQPVVIYTRFTEPELEELATTGQFVPELASLANSEDTGKYMFYLTLTGMLASKFKMNPEYKKKKQLQKEEKSKNTVSSTKNKIMLTPHKIKEPVYDSGMPKDNSQLEIIDQWSEVADPIDKYATSLLNDSELSKPELDRLKQEKTLRASLISSAEESARIRAENGSVKYASS